MIDRRTVLISGAAAVAAPRISLGKERRTLRFMPRTALVQLDPVWTTDTTTRAFGAMIWDTIYSVDETLTARPQMAEGHTIEDDGRRWTIRLREGLRFHDGEPVLARDCVASLNRWIKRDAVGRTIAARLDELSASDDRTIVFRLKKPFARLDFGLGKAQPNLAPIMPARIAETDPYEKIGDIIGSGPFRFAKDEFVAGSFAAMTKFEDYRPRDDAPSGIVVSRRVMVDRVEWRAIPDAATASGALLKGEVDWVETPFPDLLPALRSNRDLTVDIFDPYGIYPLLRMNHLQTPTDNVRLRQAVMAAIDPVELMHAVTGGDPASFTAPVGCFVPGSVADNTAGMERIGGKKPSEVRDMLREAGYSGQRTVLLHSVDSAATHAMFQIIAARLSEAGMNIDDVLMDQGTQVQRRNSKEPVEKGGWSMLIANAPGADHLDPLVALGLRTGAGAWIGWPNDL